MDGRGISTLTLFCLTLCWNVGDVVGQDVVENPPGVQEIILPMCRNFVPYNLTKLPNRFGDTTQGEIFRKIDRMWPYMDYGCSKNFRLYVCSLFLPMYDPSAPNERVEPCKETCNKAKRLCKGPMRQTRSRWPKDYKCKNLEPRRGDVPCLPPVRERRGQIEHTYCTENTIPMCQNLSLNLGSLPNHFLQRNITEISVELDFYQPVIDSQCHSEIKFLLCGLYVPFCLYQQQLPFTMPCKELCESVRGSCYDQYTAIYPGLQWPSKLQCHRFPPADGDRPCAMPGDNK